MRRFGQFLSLIAASLVGSTMIAGTALAQDTTATPSGYYVAVPVAAPAKTTLITRTTAWDRQGNAYVARRAPVRDATLCQMMARNAGTLSSFSVAGTAFDADALAKCNAHAKGDTASAATAVAR